MKKTILISIFTTALNFAVDGQIPPSQTAVESIHSKTINLLNGSTYNLNSLAGKKIVFVIAPLSVRDTAKIKAIKEFQNKYDTILQVIGILTHELGYKDSLQSKITTLYNNTNPIKLTTPMYSTATPQHAQSALLKWLLTKAENKVFDNRFAGDMQKFFIDEQGVLYHVASSSLEFASPFMEALINKKPL